MNTQNFKENGNQKFPLTTEALDFIQEQIKLVYGLTSLAGQFIIICEPTSGKDGLVIVDGELLPLKGTKSDFSRIVVLQVDERVALGDGSFEGIVRSTRVATYSIPMRGTTGGEVADFGDIVIRPRAAAAAKEYALSKFTVLKDMQTLMSELDEAKKHLMPKGTIVMWSGKIADIPTGWALCDGTNGTPNLQGRFVIGYGIYTAESPSVTYPVGSTGGKSMVKLDVQHMPAHNHGGNTGPNGGHNHSVTINEAMPQNYGHGSDGWNSANLDAKSSGNPYGTTSTVANHTHTINSAGGSQAHDNMPPYYALAYIMKVI